MKPAAIVYSSNTGHTRRYAELLGEKTGLPVYDIHDKAPAKGTPVVYMGWLMAATIKDFGKAKRRFDVRAVCGVGLCTTGALLQEVRRGAMVPDDTALFTLQGGMDLDKLTGIYRRMIDTLTRFMERKKNPTDDDREMLRLLTTTGDYVCEENLAEVLKWINM